MTAAAVRAALAAAALDLGGRWPVDPRVGPVTLRPHQRLAVARIGWALDTYRGALLADAVGLGKTWVALALLRDAHRRGGAPSPPCEPPVVVAPAVLRGMWRDAAAAADVPIAFCSTESLSAPAAPHTPALPALVVVDEAHHFRTPATRRHARLSALCSRARTVLMTATPVHNTVRDLASLLALFLGDRAATLDAATLAALVVHRRRSDLRPRQPDTRSAGTRTPDDARAPAFPRVARTRWRHLPAAAAVRDALLALPPPLPAADGTAAPSLGTLTLVRLWTSSDAALRASLRRRLARAVALGHALAAGRHLDRRALARWAAHDDALQLPLFPEGAATADARALGAHVDAYTSALRHVQVVLDAAPPADPARIAWLRAVRDAHPGARVVAFTQFADTAHAVFRALAPDGHVGVLTAAGGRIASGPLARDALLARFAPAGATPAIERVDLLVTTDCLSEGLDLRTASVVVHLDVPWTPARLAQRVGRAARLGSLHPTIHVHGLRPDPATGRWLRLARRLRAKARAARRALGAARSGTRLARHFALHHTCERWLAADAGRAPPDPAYAPPLTAAIRCGRAGFVAVCAPATARVHPPALVAALDDRAPSAAPRAVARALRQLARPDARPVAPPAALVARARALVAAWARRRSAALAVGGTPPPALDAADTGTSAAPHTAAPLRAALARGAAALRAAPPHARPARAAAVAHLRGALAVPLSAGAERALAAVAQIVGDDEWLAAAADAVGAAPGPRDDPVPGDPASAAPASHTVTALVLLLP